MLYGPPKKDPSERPDKDKISVESIAAALHYVSTGIAEKHYKNGDINEFLKEEFSPSEEWLLLARQFMEALDLEFLLEKPGSIIDLSGLSGTENG